MTVEPSAPAAGNWSTGTNRAIEALRAGEFTPKNPCCRASSPRIAHTEFSPTAACTHSRIEVTAMPVLVTSNSLRRSTASAMAPPHSPNTSSGTRATAPASPT